MAGVLRYKFKSGLSYENLLFDGMFLSVGDLKKQVAERRGMIATELAIHKPDTGEMYTSDAQLLPRNTQVVISRVPLGPQTKKVIVENKLEREAERQAQTASLTSNTFPVIPGAAMAGADGAGPGGAPIDEAAALSNFVDASYSNWSSEVHKGGRGGGKFGFGAGGRKKFHSDAPPPNYVCHRCGVSGHWIYNCPTNDNPEFDIKKVKAPVGIPLEKLVSTGEGTIVMPDGTIGDVMVDDRALKKEMSVVAAAGGAGARLPEPKEVPEEMKCPISGNLMKEAVLITCCQANFDDSCIRKILVETGTCPKCGKEDMLCDDLLPNPTLRKKIQDHLRSSVVPEAIEGGQSGNGDNGGAQAALPGPSTDAGGGAAPIDQAAPAQPPGQSVPQENATANGPEEKEAAPKKPRFMISAFRMPSKDAGGASTSADGGAAMTQGQKAVDLLKRVNRMLPNGPRAFFVEAFCKSRDRPLSRRDFQYLQGDFSQSRRRRRTRSPSPGRGGGGRPTYQSRPDKRRREASYRSPDKREERGRDEGPYRPMMRKDPLR